VNSLLYFPEVINKRRMNNKILRNQVIKRLSIELLVTWIYP